MDFTVGIVSRNLAITSNSETVGIRGNEDSVEHLAHFE